MGPTCPLLMMATNHTKTPKNISIRDMLQKSDLTSRSQVGESLPSVPTPETSVDTQTLATKEDIHLLLVKCCKDINVLRQDFTHTLSDLDVSARQLDSHLKSVETSFNDQALENVNWTTSIGKLEKNYDLIQDKLDDLENRCKRNNVHIRNAAVSSSYLEAHIQDLFPHLLGPDCDQPGAFGLHT
ncbi:hypothetical protein NDU88_004606 [Pleurodeles waltl]|uniref:Uncharacterized protein n=1 Tax=Pleurodeles waltl TaxID=8319 RepID=A0AAV7VJQ9_PLEWA|nr:hypothetical protein NDU88_004606 [Pleurodeles waltl]